MEKKLYRSNDRKLFGVCGGIAEYFGWDPTVVRILWVVIYIVAMLLMDNRPDYISPYDDKEQ